MLSRRIGKSRYGTHYDPQRVEKLSFGRAMFHNFDENGIPLHTFGDSDVTVKATFLLTQDRSSVRKDTDNMMKFLGDALHLARIINNDVQISTFCGKRICGAEEDRIFLHITRDSAK